MNAQVWTGKWIAVMALLGVHHYKQIRLRGIVVLEGRKGTGMTLSSTALTWWLREHFGKRVVSNYNLKPSWGMYNTKEMIR